MRVCRSAERRCRSGAACRPPSFHGRVYRSTRGQPRSTRERPYWLPRRPPSRRQSCRRSSGRATADDPTPSTDCRRYRPHRPAPTPANRSRRIASLLGRRTRVCFRLTWTRTRLCGGLSHTLELGWFCRAPVGGALIIYLCYGCFSVLSVTFPFRQYRSSMITPPRYEYRGTTL